MSNDRSLVNRPTHTALAAVIAGVALFALTGCASPTPEGASPTPEKVAESKFLEYLDKGEDIDAIKWCDVASERKLKPSKLAENAKLTVEKLPLESEAADKDGVGTEKMSVTADVVTDDAKEASELTVVVTFTTKTDEADNTTYEFECISSVAGRAVRGT